LWFSFADLLEFRASAGSQVPDRSLVWVFIFVIKGNQMKYSVLLAALLAVSMTACGKKEEAAAPAEAPAAAAPAPEAAAPMEAAPAPAAPEAAAPAADAAAPAADAAAPAAAPAEAPAK
jgi:type IV secretory pathway VirB10-like protein